MKKLLFILIAVQLTAFTGLHAQDLESVLESEQNDSLENEYVKGIFKTSRLINSSTVEQASANEIHVFISHRFGSVNKGIVNFFGLDESANIRIGFEYGITDNVTVGFGRSKINKLYDVYAQYKLFGQQTGLRSIPFSVCLKAGMAVNSEIKPENIENYGIYRLNYYGTLLIGSKITPRLSLQLMPLVLHQNLVKMEVDKNTVFAMGIGGRFKLGKRFSIQSEYFYVMPNQISITYYNPLSVGFEMETGGHVFQLFASNTLGMTEKAMIPYTENSWSKGDVLIGFNICRIF